MIMAPLIRDRKGEHEKVLAGARQAGFVRVRVDGELRDLDEEFSLDKKYKHSIDVVVDRLVIRRGSAEGTDGLRPDATRMADSIETALRLSDGTLLVHLPDEGKKGTDRLFSELYACPEHGGSFEEPAPRNFSFNSPFGACPDCTGLGSRLEIEPYMTTRPCPTCHGMRLKPEVLAITVGDRNIIETTQLSVTEALRWYERLPNRLTDRDNQIARQVLKEIRSRLGFLVDVGLDYLTLDRASGTLSGGEAQRIRLATQIGSSLMGVLYILDEPSIGLHQRDNDRLIG